MGIADDIASKMKGPKYYSKEEEDGEGEGDGEKKPEDKEDGEGEAEGRAMLAAIKSGDAMALYEAIRACK